MTLKGKTVLTVKADSGILPQITILNPEAAVSPDIALLLEGSRDHATIEIILLLDEITTRALSVMNATTISRTIKGENLTLRTMPAIFTTSLLAAHLGDLATRTRI